LLKKAGTAGASKIQAKLDIVYNYMKTTWGVDMDILREVIQRRQGEINTLDFDNLDVENLN
jgi:hypothetical protein